MDYNDFPILNNDEYLFLNSQYLQESSLDKKTIIARILNKVSASINGCYALDRIYNTYIQKEISSTFETLKKVEANLHSIFNIEADPPATTKSFNIFNLIKSLNEIIKLLFEWTQNENKQYHKATAYKTSFELINNLERLLSAMIKSKIDFYKHM